MARNNIWKAVEWFNVRGGTARIAAMEAAGSRRRAVRLGLLLLLMAVVTMSGGGDGGGDGDDDKAAVLILRAQANSFYSPLRRVPGRGRVCATDALACDAGGGQRCCRGLCRSVLSDRLHCGRCRRTCRAARACCAGSCVNLLTSRRHCGACSNRCARGVRCEAGICGYAS